jgi:cell wall-associated NlpC family hydrolase
VSGAVRDALKAAAGAGGRGAPLGKGSRRPARPAGSWRWRQDYLGVPYVWAGASKRGIDCSGLVLVAYRDGAGISCLIWLRRRWHAAGASRSTRSSPGDLIGWGVPGNYPHIALAVSGDRVIVAPHTGAVVRYEALYEKKVPGFGYPDAVRIL